MSNEFKLIDKADGEWLINRAQFRLAHNRSENPDVPDVVVLESGIPTKVRYDDFLKSQPTVEPCPDPMGDEPIPSVIVASENTLIPTDEVTGQPATANAPGVLGTTAETSVTGNPPTGAKKK